MAMAMLLISFVIPMVTPAGVGTGLGGVIGVEEFVPQVYQCGDRVLYDDDMQPWRSTDADQVMTERNQHYLFDGERYQVDVLVFDKNKIDDISVDLEVAGEIGSDSFTENCQPTTVDIVDCNVRIDEEHIIIFDSDTMQAYTCTVDILDSEHMYGLGEMSVIATSGLTDLEGVTEEVARWFLNPIISLSVDGELDFSDVRPGTASYSSVLLENTAEGGVLLDMFITGKDWPGADTNPLARCNDVDPNTQATTGTLVNYLPLGAFRYYAENGAYSTRDDAGTDFNTYDSTVDRNKDAEGYVNIHRQLNAGFEELFFDEAEILQAGTTINGFGYSANVLYPGSAGMSVTMRLELPEPCYGDFESATDGSIFFWGEAI